MSNVWFISDIHGGHANLVRWRSQFKTEEEHWEFVKENYHKVVTKRDTVFFLGDIAFTKERLWDLASWQGYKKFLILGNHDSERLYTRNFTAVFDQVHALYKYKEFWLSHAPIHPDELRGKFNIHGHCHEHVIDDKRYLNVCLEHTGYSPISLTEVRRRVHGES